MSGNSFICAANDNDSSDCFLCNPDPRLVFARQDGVFAMVGLGPLTSTYCMVASTSHARSLADLAIETPSAVRALNSFRVRLEGLRGPLLMTEHGRVPVCRDNEQSHDAHCFHGHALLFGTTRSILNEVSSYYTPLTPRSENWREG